MKKIKLWVPDTMYAAIEAESKDSGRSFVDEVRYRLERTLRDDATIEVMRLIVRQEVQDVVNSVKSIALAEVVKGEVRFGGDVPGPIQHQVLLAMSELDGPATVAEIANQSGLTVGGVQGAQSGMRAQRQRFWIKTTEYSDDPTKRLWVITPVGRRALKRGIARALRG